MAKAKIVLYTSKTYKDGNHPVMLRVSHRRETKYFSLKISCTKAQWDKKISRLNKSYKGYRNQNILLDFYQQKVDQIFTLFLQKQKAFSFIAFEREFLWDANSIGVIEFLGEIIDNNLKKDRIGNLKVYKQLRRMLVKFCAGKPLVFADIDYRFLKKFETFLFEHGCKGGGANFYMRTIRAVVNEAIRQGVMNRDLYPFSTQFNKAGYSLSHLKSDASPRPLSLQDMEKIKQFPITEHPELEKAIRYFLFSYYARGINFIDMAKLKWSNIYNKRIEYTRTKTGKKYTIKVSPPLQEILDHFKGYHEKYVFPILSDFHQTESQIKNRSIKCLKQYNSDLKRVAELLDININLTSYVARHTYATTLKRKGISIAVISEGLGHSDVATTKAYLDQFSTDVVDAADEVL